MDWHLILPAETGWGRADWEAAREIRLRPGRPVSFLGPKGMGWGTHPLSPEEIFRAAQALSGHRLAARAEELREGFLALPGGHRLGVCGRLGPQGFEEISSLCVRMAHEIKGVGDALFPQVQGRNLLICGAPGAGKTTLLRDLIRLYGLVGTQVGLADARGEVAACQGGAPQLDVGPCCDVITGGRRSKTLLLLLRAMAPQVLATDEIGGAEDFLALSEARRCGALLLATLHAGSLEDIKKRPGLRPLLQEGLFDQAVLLPGPGEPPILYGEDALCNG